MNARVWVVDVLVVGSAVAAGFTWRSLLRQVVPASARSILWTMFEDLLQHVVLVVCAALALRSVYARHPLPHTVERRLLHPIGLLAGTPWMSSIKTSQHTLLAIARAAWGLGPLPLDSTRRVALETLCSAGFATALSMVIANALTQLAASCERTEQRHVESKQRFAAAAAADFFAEGGASAAPSEVARGTGTMFRNPRVGRAVVTRGGAVHLRVDTHPPRRRPPTRAASGLARSRGATRTRAAAAASARCRRRIRRCCTSRRR